MFSSLGKYSYDYQDLLYASDCSALHISARNKQNFALRTLLTALRESCAANDVAQVVNAQNLRGQTPLHCAVRAGDADCVHYLLNAGASYDIPDNNFDTVR
ncbi:unnamed protein product [Anisakis simplex]|uniref:IKB-1 (inferred by orthology to a C. elegans protein) n=1 Tax=Anisakis simplex TaxID=6269 RepID=A0A0M3JQ31_ANISI|nr:unnamed protein product [Anisakis simplex]